MTTITTLRNQIMRRIFYAYGIRVVLSPLFIYGVMFTIGLFLLARTVHVAMVWENFINQPVANVPRFMANTLSHSEILTLLSVAFLLVSSIMIARAVWSARFFLMYRHQWS